MVHTKMSRITLYVHHMVPKTTSQNHVFEPSNATMIQQIIVAADLTHNEDLLGLKPG